MDDDTAISACKAKMFQLYYNTTIYAEHLRIFTSHIALAMKMAFSLSAVFTLSTTTAPPALCLSRAGAKKILPLSIFPLFMT